MSTGVVVWSKTAATNNTADSAQNWQEGMAPSAVNDSARAGMASVAKWRDDLNGSLATAGGTLAFTLTTNQVFAALTAGYQVAFQMNATNTGTTTLNVDGLGAKPLRSAAGVELLAGSLLIGAVYKATYFTSNSGEWLVESYPVLGDAQIAAAKLASNAVTTAKILDANVTLAKMESRTTKRAIGRNTAGTGVPEEVTAEQILAWIGTPAAGDILYDTGSAIVRLPKGTNGQVLSLASGLPSWTTNGRVLLNTLTASGSAALQDTTSFTSTYKFYDIELVRLLVGTDATTLMLQVQSGGSFKSSGYLNLCAEQVNNGNFGYDTSTTSIALSATSTASNAAPGRSGLIKVYDPSAAAICTIHGTVAGNYVTSGFMSRATVQGYWNTAAVVTGFQILASSGVLTSGIVKVYGYN